jgi:hypothetical protein
VVSDAPPALTADVAVRVRGSGAGEDKAERGAGKDKGKGGKDSKAEDTVKENGKPQGK